jgi:hypothetical protein
MKMTPSTTLQTLSDVLAWLRSSPPGTLVTAADIYHVLQGVTDGAPAPFGREGSPVPVSTSWRERLWTAPEETRIGVTELAEALGKTKWWVYRQTGARSGPLAIPHRKLEGALVFIVGEVKAWLPTHEDVIRSSPSSVSIEAGRRASHLSRRRSRAPR